MATELFSAVRIGDCDLPNRIVMAPLTRNRAGQGGVPQTLNVTYYAQRASAGLIITEATQISPQGVGYPNTPGIHTRAQIEGWQQVTRAVHDKGGHIFLQLWHVGRISHPSLQPEQALPVAPSAVKPDGDAFTYTGLQPFVTPRALSLEEIPAIVEDYRKAAANAMQAGFDGVEIHAANGYLIDQFLRDGSNRRDDEYGGSVENRCRFLLQVTQAVVEAAGARRTGIRVSPVNPFNSMSDSNPQALFNAVAAALRPFGLAYLHAVEGAIHSDSGVPAFDIQAMRRLFGGPYIANGGYTRERAIQAVSDGAADLVSFGELFLANPDLPERLKANAPLNTPDPATFYGGGAAGYTDYPALSA
jgi:N-ethylmaleimide reductase